MLPQTERSTKLATVEIITKEAELVMTTDCRTPTGFTWSGRWVQTAILLYIF